MATASVNPNPHNLRDGEFLPIVGGPRDGHHRTVSLLLGLIPSSGFVFGDHVYRLDQASRRWVYEGEREKGGK